MSNEVPGPVRRQWSDALAAAGLFAEALRAQPASERADIVRRVELAVLAGEHKLALHMLSELQSGRTARVARPPASGQPGRVPRQGGSSEAGSPVEPWLEFLTHCAHLVAGQVKRLDDVLKAAENLSPSPGLAWMLALAAASAGDLERARPAAAEARAGGCRDLRILAILAAGRAADDDDTGALDLLRQAFRIALPAENPARYALDLLHRAGLPDDAQRLGELGRAGGSPATRLTELIGLTNMTALIGRLRDRQLRAAGRRDLTCRCSGSTGWVGANRMYYVTRHLSVLPIAPVTGLNARLLLCRATHLTFLDLPARQVTLPVISELRPPATPPWVGPSTAGPVAIDLAAAGPTAGMGVSLGPALRR